MKREDFEITELWIHDTFRYAGREFHGLKELQKVAYDKYNKEERMGDSPYVVLREKRYPCFDSEDYANEDRYYQNYYFTTDREKAERICEETDVLYRFKGNVEEYPILEPMFSMGKIEERHLPYIYYHGEGDTMQVVQSRLAPEDDKITRVSPKPIEVKVPNPFEIDDPPYCMYGPPPGEYEDWEDKLEDEYEL